MKKRILLLCIGIICSYSLTIAQSKDTFVSVDFKIRNLGINVDGRFNTASVTMNFESEDYEDWYLEGYVEVNTIDTDNMARDKHLLEPDYFDAEKHPKITIVSKSFKKMVWFSLFVKSYVPRTNSSLLMHKAISILSESPEIILPSDSLSITYIPKLYSLSFILRTIGHDSLFLTTSH